MEHYVLFINDVTIYLSRLTAVSTNNVARTHARTQTSHSVNNNRRVIPRREVGSSVDCCGNSWFPPSVCSRSRISWCRWPLSWRNRCGNLRPAGGKWTWTEKVQLSAESTVTITDVTVILKSAVIDTLRHAWWISVVVDYYINIKQLQ